MDYFLRNLVRRKRIISWFNINPLFILSSEIDRAPQLHFSTLEKTKIDHNPLLNNLVVTVSQVSPIDRLPRQIFQDLDIHARILECLSPVTSEVQSFLSEWLALCLRLFNLPRHVWLGFIS